MNNIVIVGTAHVSKKSVEEVEKIIEEEMPDAVAVELDLKRFEALTGKKQDVDLLEVIKDGNLFLFIFQIILSNLQRKIGKETGVNPGEEMLRAIEKAKEIGADVLLIDRDIAITMKRLWSGISIKEKLKLIYHLIFGKEDIDLEEVLEKNAMDYLIDEFRRISPKAAEVLIDERDAFMAKALVDASKRYNKIVAIVGAGHKDGITKYLQNPESIPDVKRLIEVKERKISVLKVLGFVLTSFTIFMLLSILITLGTSEFLSAFLFWFLVNGIPSSIFAAIAGGHILSILTAFCVAWLTSLSPLLAAGWFSGLVEFMIRKPKQSDFEEMLSSESLRALYRNRAFRVLLVAALTNVGSMIGTFVGIWYLSTHYGINIKEVIWKILFRF